MQRFFDLKLERSRSPVFALSWTVMHKITPDSPIFGLSEEEMKKMALDLFVSFSGLDSVYMQSVHVAHRYRSTEFVFNRKFEDVISTSPDGVRTIDFNKFHSLV